jgi:hypothetical protein
MISQSEYLKPDNDLIDEVQFYKTIKKHADKNEFDIIEEIII